jgi:hypothetical protein
VAGHNGIQWGSTNRRITVHKVRLHLKITKAKKAGGMAQKKGGRPTLPVTGDHVVDQA